MHSFQKSFQLIFFFSLFMILIFECLFLLYLHLLISIVHAEDIPVPDNLIAEYLKQDIVISNPLLDYAYSRQDIENMVIATSRGHKDSEEYNITVEEAITNRSSSKKQNDLI